MPRSPARLRPRNTRVAALLVAAALVAGGCSPVETSSGGSAGASPFDATASASPEAFGASPSPEASAFVATPVAARLPGEPDPRLTPGAFNPAVTQGAIGKTICVRGWTATVRPPEPYTEALKRSQIAAYRYADRRLSSYEEDHLIPLELGGAPRDPRNLWPEPRTASLPDGTPLGAAVKDELENRLNEAVCAGSMTLAEARAEIGIHWAHVLLRLPVP